LLINSVVKNRCRFVVCEGIMAPLADRFLPAF
jgi:hypothetical protein